MSITSTPGRGNGAATVRLRTDVIRQRADELGFGRVTEMAERFGLSKQAMHALLRHQSPTLATTVRIAAALGVPIEDLITTDDAGVAA